MENNNNKTKQKAAKQCSWIFQYYVMSFEELLFLRFFTIASFLLSTCFHFNDKVSFFSWTAAIFLFALSINAVAMVTLPNLDRATESCLLASEMSFAAASYSWSKSFSNDCKHFMPSSFFPSIFFNSRHCIFSSFFFFASSSFCFCASFCFACSSNHFA